LGVNGSSGSFRANGYLGSGSSALLCNDWRTSRGAREKNRPLCSACLRLKKRPIRGRKKTSRGFVLLASRSNFPGLWPKPKGPIQGFGLILSPSFKSYDLVLIDFCYGIEHHEGPVLDINLVQKWIRGVKLSPRSWPINPPTSFHQL
jgi:hypothetical protein